MKRNDIMTNCQSKINTLSTNSSTTKSIFVSLSVAIVAAYYGSSFFEELFCPNDSFWYMFWITVVFWVLEIITNVIFTYILMTNLSIERGYIALYYYCDKVKELKKDKLRYNDEINSQFVPYRYISNREYKRADQEKQKAIIDKCHEYLIARNQKEYEMSDDEIIKEYHMDNRINDIRLRKCFKSNSIKWFSYANMATWVCIVALFLIRVLVK